MASTLSAQTPNWFPLQIGNTWLYRPAPTNRLNSQESRTISVHSKETFAGREYFRPPFAEAVEDGDVLAFARAVERLVRRIDEDPVGTAALGDAGARFALDRYSPAREQSDLVDVFAPLLRADAAASDVPAA